MKKCLRYLVYFAIAGFAAGISLIALLFIPGVQLAILHRVLPPESEVAEFRLTPGAVRFVDLRIPFENGDQLKVGNLEARIRPFKWFSSRTVWVDSVRAWSVDFERAERIDPELEEVSDEMATLESIVAALRELEALRFRLHIGEVALEGLLSDAELGVVRYEFQVNDIAPGREGFMRFAGTRPAQRQAGGPDLPEIAIEARVRYRQSSAGGPESFRAEMAASGLDDRNQRFLNLSAETGIDFVTDHNRITLLTTADLSVARPELLDPALAGLEPLSLDARLAMEINERDRVRLESIQTFFKVGDNVELRVDLAQPIELDLNAFPTGPILAAHLRVADPAKLPLGGDDWTVSDAGPLTVRIDLAGEDSGELVFGVEDLQVGPFSLRQGDEEIVRRMALTSAPIQGRLDPAGNLRVDLPALALSLNGENAATVSARLKGNVVNQRFELDAQTEARFSVWLAEQYFRERMPVAPDGLGGLSATVRAAVSPEAMTVETLRAGVTDAAGAALFSAEAKQRFSINPETGEVSPTERGADLLHFRLAGLPSALIAPFLPGEWGVRYQNIGGDFALGSAENGLELRTVEPLRIDGLNVQHLGEPLLANLRLSAAGRAKLAPTAWTAAALEIGIAGARGEMLRLQLDASGSSTEWMPDVEGATFALESSGDLSRLAEQPALRQQLVPLRSGRFSLRANSPGLDQSVDLGVHVRELQAASDLRGPVFDLRMDATISTPLAESGRLRGTTQLQSSTDFRVTDRWTLDVAWQESSSGRDINGVLNANRIRLAEVMSLAALLESPDTPAPATAPGPSGRPRVVAYEPALWEGLRGKVNFSADQIVLTNGAISGLVRGEIVFADDSISLNPFEAHFGKGRLQGQFIARADAAAGLHTLRTVGQFRDIEPGVLMDHTKRWAGAVNGSWELSGKGPTVAVAAERMIGEVRMDGSEGRITALNLESPVGGAAMIGIGLLGSQVAQPGIAAFARVIPHFNQIPYDAIQLHLRRLETGEVEVRNIELNGPALLLRGDGRIAPGPWRDMVSQPILLSFEFGAKGELAGNMAVLGLIQNEVNTSGFRMGSSGLSIGGSLSDPDASSVQQLLWRAALAAVGRRPAAAPPGNGTRTDAADQSQEPPRSDLDRGLDLLEGLLRRR